MSGCFQEVVACMAVLTAVVAGGCAAPVPPPAPGPSAFYMACRNPSPLVSQAASAAGCALEARGSYEGESGQGTSFDRSAGLSCLVRSDRAGAEKVLLALKGMVLELAGQTGAEVMDTGERKDADGHVTGFVVQHGSGNVHGRYEASLQPTSPLPGGPKAEGYELTVQIKEWPR